MGSVAACEPCGFRVDLSDDIPDLTLPARRDEEEPPYDHRYYATLFEREQQHFWHAARRDLIMDVVRLAFPHPRGRPRVLEIGCGNGSILQHLRQHGLDVVGGDLLLTGLRFCRKRLPETPLFRMDAAAVPFREAFDAIGLFDTLEHVPDDHRVLASCREALRPGGALILTVPAHRSLWGYFDELSFHRRRYERSDLRKLLEDTGYRIERMTHVFAFLFPLLYTVRRITHRLREGEVPPEPDCAELRVVPVVNGILRTICRLERRLLRRRSLPFGSSLLALARRDDGP